MDKERELLSVENDVLDKVAGKINMSQSLKDKEEVVLDVLSQVCGSLHTEERKEAIRALRSDDERKKFVKDFLSYGIIEDLLREPNTEDIIINSLNTIFIHHSSKGFVKTDKKFNSAAELDIFVKKLVVLSGRKVVNKINDLELTDMKARVNIVTSPYGPQVTITRMKERPLSIIDLIDNSALTFDLAAQLWLYVEGMSVKPANLMIVGGPGAGKTTLMNALLSFIPDNERLVVIEDTLELNTDLEDNCSRLASDTDITLKDLVKNSLRMRPDRLIIGEVRGSEAQDLMTAMNIGKYCMGTLHASTAREAVIRLQNEPMNIPETLINLVDVFVIMKKIHTPNKVLRVIEEVVETAGLEQKIVLLSQVWGFDYEKKVTAVDLGSTVYRDRLAKAMGLTPKDIIRELRIRAKVLEILKQKGIHKIEEITRFSRMYNNNPAKALAELGLTKEGLVRDFKL